MLLTPLLYRHPPDVMGLFLVASSAGKDPFHGVLRTLSHLGQVDLSCPFDQIEGGERVASEVRLDPANPLHFNSVAHAGVE